MFKRKNHFVGLLEEVLKYKIYIIIALSVVAASGGGYYFYRSYDNNVQEKAHTSFVECMQYFNAIVGEDDKLGYEDVESFKTEKDKWEEVNRAFREGYQENKSSNLSGMFLTYQSEALLRLGQYEESISILEKALPLVKTEQLKQIYLLKYALMLLDFHEDTQPRALKILEALANDKYFASLVDKVGDRPIRLYGDTNYVHDQALYRLGEFYWYRSNFDLTKNYWNQLVSKYGRGTEHPSELARSAYDNLKMIQSNG